MLNLIDKEFQSNPAKSAQISKSLRFSTRLLIENATNRKKKIRIEPKKAPKMPF